MIESVEHPDGHRWKRLFFVRLVFAAVYGAGLIALVISAEESVIMLTILWTLPIVIYLFALQTATMSVGIGLLLSLAIHMWVMDEWTEQAFGSFGDLQAVAEGVMLFGVVMVGLVVDLIGLALARRADRLELQGDRTR